MNYYNENDKFAVKWLKSLIANGLIPKGDVDERSITKVKPNDLEGYNQCHFFAGIAGWPQALKLAGWDASRPVWTGSCPCQSLSCAGKRLGEKDERHLWPVFFGLISELRPAIIFGEQVVSKLGREWLSGVRTDLETVGYAVGAADLPAASVGAPHKRNRLFWVGHANQQRLESLTRIEEIKDGPITATNFWANYAVIQCAERKSRKVPVEPALQPLAPRVQGRVGLLRSAGNAIVPQVAAEFIKAFMEIMR